MKKRRILSVLLCLALVAFSLSGCNKTSSKKSTSSKKADSGTLQGMIKSVDVDKKQITIATMPSGNQPPSKPDGDSNAQMPQQEETVYKLNDASKLMDKDGNTITLKKLSEGDFVEFTAKNSYRWRFLIKRKVREKPVEEMAAVNRQSILRLNNILHTNHRKCDAKYI